MREFRKKLREYNKIAKYWFRNAKYKSQKPYDDALVFTLETVQIIQNKKGTKLIRMNKKKQGK